jgi:hypothetical protein
MELMTAILIGEKTELLIGLLLTEAISVSKDITILTEQVTLPA